MLLKKLLPISLLLLTFSYADAQEVPKGVNYKRASDAINEKARKSLETALAVTDALPADFFDTVTIVGPMLWKALDTQTKVLADAKPIIIIVPGPQPITTQGRRLLTDEERKTFWLLFRQKFSNLKDANIRKGNAQEISYYWATIPFDIEEPFWVLETSNERFIVHFQVKDEQPRLFWMDLVGDLQTLKPR